MDPPRRRRHPARRCRHQRCLPPHRPRHQSRQLTDVWRFTHPCERHASLQLRQGNKSVIDTYDHHRRLTHGSVEQMETAAYRAWLHDTNQGRSSMAAALREIEEQILRRADWLADQAENNREPWFTTLQDLTHDLSTEGSRTWLRHIAAHRERYGVRGEEILSSELTRDLNRLKARQRLIDLIGQPAVGPVPGTDLA